MDTRRNPVIMGHCGSASPPIRCRVSRRTIGAQGNDLIVELDCHQVYDDGTYDREPMPLRVSAETWQRVRLGASWGDVVTFAPDEILSPP